ncbi:RNA polymerase II transcriptional coactivator KIWI [Glycine soja]
MSGKAKRRDDDGASDADSEGHAPPKKSLKKDSDDDPDSITVCEISKNRRVAVRNWKGSIMVDIREFYVKDGKQLPGRKGISLTMDQWNVLRNHVEDIDKAINENS